MSTVKAGRDLWAERHPAPTQPTQPTQDTAPAPAPTTLGGWPLGKVQQYATNTALDPQPATVDQGAPNPWRDNRVRADWQAATQTDNVHVGLPGGTAA